MILLPISPSGAAQTVVRLVPGSTSIVMTIYAMSLFPLPAQFSRFSGNLTLEAGAPPSCAVALRIEASSLQMDDPVYAQLAIGPQLLDAKEYPTLVYTGGCAPGHTSGVLTLHGVSKPLALTTQRDGDTVTAAGTLKRQEFGVAGLPALIGQTIQIRLKTRLPPGVAAQIDP